MSSSICGVRLSAVVIAIFGITTGSILAATVPAVATDWAQAHSDLPADPTVLFGKLPNGMRYAIKHNATPKGAVVMRFAIQAGSLQESDAQQGLAHFLEHMAFRGSRHVPEDQVMPGLQRLGMGFGADINASTGWTQTTYKLNLPHNDAATVDAGLMRLREDASELTLAQRAMDDERGVILSEERMTSTPELRSLEAKLRFLLPGSLTASRMPIGKTDIIQHAPVSLIRDFYSAYYRPERAALIVVGDIDPKAIETKIRDRFTDWKSTGPAGIDPKQSPLGTLGAQAALFVEPGAPSYMSLSWVTNPVATDTKQFEQKDLLELVGLKIITDRLETLAAGPKHPFTAAGMDFQNNAFHFANLKSINLTLNPQDWRAAVEAAVNSVRRIDQYGVTADEATRVMSEFRAQFQALAAGADTLSSERVADTLVKSVDEDSVDLSPADSLALIDETFKDLTAEKLTAAIRNMMRGHGPLLFLSSPSPIEGGQAALTAALAAAEKAPLTDMAAAANVAWPYTSFGSPGQVVDRKAIADLQTTFVRFANGVRLTVKPTSFTTGGVEVGLRVGNSRLPLSTDHGNADWAVNDGAFVLGGFKAISFDDALRALAGKVYQVKARTTEDGLILGGHTRPADLATELQVLAAYVSAPGWREGALERARSTATSNLVTEAASPTGLFLRELHGLLQSGDPRRTAPSLAEINSLKMDTFKTLLAKQLASAPLELTVVGDVSVDAAIKAAAETFGALPSRPDTKVVAEVPPPGAFPAPTATPVEIHHKGRADQGGAAIGWPTRDAFDPHTTSALTILKDVIEWRLTEQLRVRDAATYTPEAVSVNSASLAGFGFLLAYTELTSSKMPLFFQTTHAIAADLRANPISADELQRARKPEVERIAHRQQTNSYWAQELIGTQTDPRRLDIVRNALPALEKVSSADVQHVAQTYLVDAKAWEAVVTPEAAAHTSR